MVKFKGFDAAELLNAAGNQCCAGFGRENII